MIIKNVIKDLEQLERDRLDISGGSQTRNNHSSEFWLKESYKNILNLAISLRNLMNETIEKKEPTTKL